MISITITALTFEIQKTTTDEDFLAAIAIHTSASAQNNKEKTCEHNSTQIEILTPTCQTVGEEQAYCLNCQEILYTKELDKAPHKYTIESIVPTCTQNGESCGVCKECGAKTNTEIIDKLAHTTKNTVSKNRTCTTNGEEITHCVVCETVISTKSISATGHKWVCISENKATPLENGTITYKCNNSGCRAEKSEETFFEAKGSTNLYIPAISFNKSVVLAKCNQSNTDKYDICCDMNFISGNNPVFFGHNTRSFSKLCKVKTGDYIYFTVNGETLLYKVTISEKAYTINGGTDIEGYYCKEKLIYNSNWNNTIRFFTCYSDGLSSANRWMVVAQKVE